MRLLLLLLLAACAHRPPFQTGIASWYGPGLQGNLTASGERFRMARRTAAHKTLPFGTVLKVERIDTRATVRVVVNDRGPFVEDRVIDLAKGAARRLDLITIGLAEVRFRPVGCRRRYNGCTP